VGTYASLPLAAAMSVVLGGALLLLCACVGHLRDFDRLRAALVGQRVVPYRWHRSFAGAIILVELGVGAVVCGSVVLTDPFPAWVLAVETGTYGVMLGYLTLLRLTRRDAPCGCFRGDGPVGVPALLRAGVFALGAGCALLLANGTRVDASAVPLVAASSVVVAILAWALPKLGAERAGAAPPVGSDPRHELTI